MKRCGVCGRQFAATAKFCGEDGTPLAEDNPTPGVGAQPSAFESLAGDARAGGGARAQVGILWGAPDRLPAGVLLTRGDNMLPICCPVEGRTAAMAFTDHYAAQQFRKAQQYGEKDDISVMLLSVESASEMLLGLRPRGVELVAFNNAGEGYYVPLQNLPGLYHYFNHGRELPCLARANDGFAQVNPGYAGLDQL